MPDSALRYSCCFCGQTIEPIIPDVASLVYTTCFDQQRKLQKDQQFFCHTKCFRDRLHQKRNLYVVDLLPKADIPTQAKKS